MSKTTMADIVEDAKAFLQNFLAAGPRDADAVFQRGAKVGEFKKHHLRLAGRRLGISRKQGTIYKAAGTWCWMLPGVYNTINLGYLRQHLNPTEIQLELDEQERWNRTKELNSQVETKQARA